MASGSRWPRGLLGMLAIVAAAEGYVARNDRDFTTLWASAWKRSERAARDEARSASILCLGDSLVKHGVVPRVVEQSTGLPAYNLALFNGMAPSSYFLLRRALDAGARPAAVVIDGEMIEVSPRVHMRLWSELVTPREAAELAWTAGDAGLFGEVATAGVLPTFEARYEIRGNVLAALRGVHPEARFALLPAWRNWRQNRGSHLVAAEPATPERARIFAEHAKFVPGPWSCHPANHAFVRRLLRLTASRGIPVFWLLPPVHPGVQAGRDVHRDRGYRQYLAAQQRRYPHLTVIDGQHAGFDLAEFHDLTHLNRDGAVAFSQQIGAVLRDRLDPAGPRPSDRWVALQKPPSRPAGVPVEDLEESKLALRSRYSTRVK